MRAISYIDALLLLLAACSGWYFSAFSSGMLFATSSGDVRWCHDSGMMASHEDRLVGAIIFILPFGIYRATYSRQLISAAEFSLRLIGASAYALLLTSVGCGDYFLSISYAKDYSLALVLVAFLVSQVLFVCNFVWGIAFKEP